MKLFSCQACGQLLYFENTRCEKCKRLLGYLPETGIVSALEPLDNDEWFAIALDQSRFRLCGNARFDTCNWLLANNDPNDYCLACRHNRVIPDLNEQGNQALWGRIEVAKHRLFYTLLRLGLPLRTRMQDADHGLAFDFLAEAPQAHAAHVMIGHDEGIITLALNEADDAVREQVRSAMNEPYRTLLGHFRHESGHYFWDQLVRSDSGQLESFRALFGDDRKDYDEALKEHYSNGPPPDWQERYLSVYATTHPWEDFAETWAHYLHIVDTLETAGSFGLKIEPAEAHGELSAKIDFDPHNASGIEQLIDAWLPLAYAVNSLNRSMGHPDLYPFVLAGPVIDKLRFVHNVTHGRPNELQTV